MLANVLLSAIGWRTNTPKNFKIKLNMWLVILRVKVYALEVSLVLWRRRMPAGLYDVVYFLFLGYLFIKISIISRYV